ncbi:hypothetical protein I5G62_gp87 [Mycobacterium phage CRB2]|uniref:Uncharacterized protein n=1 Tax=Mycobacterium phage CRB2 TaxID=2483623 RepID=A0A455LM47_9CAUD|nr:hypothetical protein I5G62_gp87 [Mycobacterium phage CRB2]AYP70072.1 hypothetical protein CRB2_87 [Mycobacterium phage CRB2]
MSETPAQTEPKYPHVEVELVGQDGNALSIIGRVSAALRRAGVGSEEIAEFTSEAMSGDYDNVIATACRWVEVS